VGVKEAAMSERAWSRLPEEPEGRYLAFLHYLAQGADVADRSIADTARAVNVRASVAVEWSRTHDWNDRARAFDASAAVTVLDDLRAQRAEFIRRHLRVSTSSQTIAERALGHLGIMQDRFDSGAEAEPPVIRATDIKALADMAAAAEAHATQMATQKTPGDTTDGTGGADVDVSRIMADPALLEQALALGDELTA